MYTGFAGGALCAVAGVVAYGVRSRSSNLLAPSVWRGVRDRKAIALTFDDGPAESTPRLLDVLEREGARATFFQCGANIRRVPQVAREVARRGHEIGNHSDTHPRFYFRTSAFMEREMAQAQATIQETSGVVPKLFRVPYGARWFGLRGAQKRLGLKGVMWTAIGLDWKLRARDIAARLSRSARNGAILCLHDGRGLVADPDIGESIEAVRILLPELKSRGFRFETVSEILCPTNKSRE